MSLIFARNLRGFTRFGVVVSKKVEKSAVRRNRIRRRIYEAIRTNLDLIPKNKDYLFVVFSKDVGVMNFSELEKLLGQLVEESKIKTDKEKFYDIIR